MNPDQIFYVVITAIVCGCLAIASPFLAYFWYAARKAEQDAVLKKTMLDRGMSTDEIARVLGAGPAGGEKKAARGLTDVLVSNWYEAGDITAITAAVNRFPADDREDARRAAVRMAEEWYDGSDIVTVLSERAAAGRRPQEAACPA